MLLLLRAGAPQAGPVLFLRADPDHASPVMVRGRFLVVARPQVSSAATAAIAGTDSNVVTKIESRASTSARP